LLLEAFANWRASSGRTQDAVLVLAGPEEGDGFLPKLQSMADRLGIRDKVLFTGPLYDDAKWSAYRDADLFVLPSQNENFGNTAGEAAACGTPVIVTDRCGIASFVGAAGEVIPHVLSARGSDASRELPGGLPPVCEEPFVGRASGSDRGNVPTLHRYEVMKLQAAARLYGARSEGLRDPFRWELLLHQSRFRWEPPASAGGS
jgi:hypothetical protein